MRPIAPVMLPLERTRQLKTVADARSVKIVDVIERIIADAIAAGEIPDETPGYLIAPRGKKTEVTFVTDDGQLGFPRLRAADARRMADELDAIATGGKGRAFGPLFGRTLKVARVGRGVALVCTDDADAEIARRTVTPSLARDLARQLRKAADAA